MTQARRLLYSLTTCIFACSVTACTAPRAADADYFTFSTRILDSGLKLFELTYPYLPHQVRLPGRSNTDSKRRDESFSEDKLEKVLEQKLEQSQFCREGYILLGRHAGNTAQRIRGECRDKATAEDRRHHPDTITRW